ncbi:MAG TPA: sucrase ferredoxin [Pyrinomonadaceae bacterium]|nr:sucrase ferredoxin [Pyrinomonadaceae bacterium]
MSRPFFYCSELSLVSAERSFGTASIGEVWLLVEYREAWGAHALEDSALPAEVKSRLNNFCQTTQRSRILFIKQERLRQDPLTCFVVRCRESAPSIMKFHFDGYEELLKLDVAALAAGDAAVAQAVGAVKAEDSLFLVCTHGKRDKCCAKFGYALYKSLREAAGGDERAAGANSSVWQSSHVGGDRFAANLLCFPHGLFYAHVTEDRGRTICDEYEARRLILEGYRGRACYSYPVQAAEFFIRRETGLAALDALRFRRQERTGDKSWLVKFIETGTGGARIHEAHVAARPSEFHNYITCQSANEQRVVQYALESYRAAEQPARVE